MEHQPSAGKWVELTPEEIDDLLCLEWLAGEIYDVSKPKSAEAREKTSHPRGSPEPRGATSVRVLDRFALREVPQAPL